MVERFPITPEGFLKLEKELYKLKTSERPAVINAIAEARAHGDLSENAEYHSAKEKQGFIEAKIKDLEDKLSRSHIIKIESINANQVQFGATVRVVDEDTKASIAYKIVSDYEANAGKNHISIFSPMAKALIGKKVGESIEVHVPKGSKYYEIVFIEYK
jgi:transcription elongation factor GreA